MLGTAYWPTYLARVDDWEVDLLRPSEDIPTIVIYTGSTAACTRSIGSVSNNLCAQVRSLHAPLPFPPGSPLRFPPCMRMSQHVPCLPLGHEPPPPPPPPTPSAP